MYKNIDVVVEKLITDVINIVIFLGGIISLSAIFFPSLPLDMRVILILFGLVGVFLSLGSILERLREYPISYLKLIKRGLLNEYK